jgi:hypothetical protein
VKVAVVGGGIAGLAIAARLLRTHDVRVFERAPEPGGKIRSERIDGYTFDWGPTGYLSNASELAAFVDELGLGAETVGAASAAASRAIFYDGRLHRLPRRPVEVLDLALVSTLGKLSVFKEPFVSRYEQRNPERDESVFEFVERRDHVFGAECNAGDAHRRVWNAVQFGRQGRVEIGCDDGRIVGGNCEHHTVGHTALGGGALAALQRQFPTVARAFEPREPGAGLQSFAEQVRQTCDQARHTGRAEVGEMPGLAPPFKGPQEERTVFAFGRAHPREQRI